jgi:hypothetical protein
MKASVIYVDNPFDPLSRRAGEVRFQASVARLAPRGRRPVIALLNGQPVLRAHRGWQRKRLRDADQLMFVTLPRGGGGGGGNGGSNPAQVLLTVALFAFAGPLATQLTGISAATAALGGVNGMIFAGTQMAVQMAGASLINAMMPNARSGSTPNPSPTYNLTAQGNTARLEQPIPVQYGRVLSYPDFAAQPYYEYVGEEQFLYQLLCLGCGEFDIEEIRIEDTPISAFAEITYEVVQPGGDVTLFPTSVVTSTEVSGQELLGLQTGTWTRASTVITVTRTAHGYAVGQVKYLDFTSGGATSDAYAITGVTANTFTVTVPAVGTSGNCNIQAVLGGIDGFVASPAGSNANKIGIDFVLPIGLYFRNGSGKLEARTAGFKVQARQVDEFGAAIGSWITLEAGTITGRSVSPQRRSYRYDLATPGRYRVRAWRTNARQTGSDYGDQLLWGGLRTYMAEPDDRGPVTLIALRMQATNNLSLQASRRIGVISTRKVPVWTGSSWSAPVASKSIAWAIADAARNTDYGAGLPDAKLDLPALLALDAVWAARGDTFNGRFDSSSSWWEAVQKIATAGRAQCFRQGGVLRVVRDGPQSVPVALFSMRNIKAGSFRIDYLMPTESNSDAVTATYWDANTWAPQRVTGKVPGSVAAKPAKLALFGVDNRPQALREATYHAAANRYRRRMVGFETEMEGFIPAYGDLIAVQHDMPGWGLHAECVGWNAETSTLTLSEPVTVTGSSVVGLRRDDGSLCGPWPILMAGPTAFDVILAETPDLTPVVRAQSRERTYATIGTPSTWSTMARVIRVQPRGLYEVAIECVTEDPSVHTAEDGVFAPPIRTSMLPRRVSKPVVSGLIGRRIPGETNRAVFGWEAAPGAEIYNLEMAEGSDVLDPDTGWTRVADTAATQRVSDLMFANRTMVRVRASGLAAGPWVAATIGALIPDMYNTDDTPFYTADINPMWST